MDFASMFCGTGPVVFSSFQVVSGHWIVATRSGSDERTKVQGLRAKDRFIGAGLCQVVNPLCRNSCSKSYNSTGGHQREHSVHAPGVVKSQYDLRAT